MSNSITYRGKTFTDEEIVSGNISKKQSLSMTELSVDTAEIVLRPLSQWMSTLDFLVPYAEYTANSKTIVKQRCQFKTRDGKKFKVGDASQGKLFSDFTQNEAVTQAIDNTLIDVWYLQDVERVSKTDFKISAMSLLGKLTQKTHYGGMYTETRAKTIIDGICGNIPHRYNSVFESVNVTVSGWLPIATARDNLQQVLFAIGANLRTAIDENPNTHEKYAVLVIENLSPVSQGATTKSNVYASGASVNYGKPVTKIAVVEHKYTPDTSANAKELFSSGNAVSNKLITFSEPMHTLSYPSTLTVSSSGANFAIVSGTGVLTGKPYIHTTVEVEEDVDSSSQTQNIVRVDNATLVDSFAGATVATRLAAYYSCRNKVNVSMVGRSVTAGNVISAYDPYDETSESACVESSQVSISSVAKNTLTAVIGYIPYQRVNTANVYEVLTTNSAFTFTDVEANTEVHVTLIGAGQGGSNGSNGGDGESNSYSVVVPANTRNYRAEAAQGSGGSSGAAGNGGVGGKVLEFTITVNNGDTFTPTIGTGGAPGGAITSAMNTLFAGRSSAEGVSSSSGYYFNNGTTQKYFAKPGTNGVSGGAGGNGGSTSNPNGENGEAASDGTRGGNGGYGNYGIIISGQPASGFCGGGGAGGLKGIEGENGNHVYSGEPSNFIGNGGVGISAPSAVSVDQTLYGSGGNGGNGGNGGGGAGCIVDLLDNPNSYSIVKTNSRRGGAGGTGSSGTAGVQGCVILSYRRLAQ